MKRLTREQKRRAQRVRANLVATAVLAAIFAAGILVGRCVRDPKEVQPTGLEEPENTGSVEASEMSTDPAIIRAVDLKETPAEVEEDPAYYPLTLEERSIVERVVMAEAEGEGFDGQRLVAQCILNSALAKGIRPDEVVLEPGQYAEPEDYASEMVMDAVSAVFDDGNFVTDEPIRWFYAPTKCESTWHESLEFVLEYGGHRFFKDPGGGAA